MSVCMSFNISVWQAVCLSFRMQVWLFFSSVKRTHKILSLTHFNCHIIFFCLYLFVSLCVFLYCPYFYGTIPIARTYIFLYTCLCVCLFLCLLVYFYLLSCTLLLWILYLHVSLTLSPTSLWVGTSSSRIRRPPTQPTRINRQSIIQ